MSSSSGEAIFAWLAGLDSRHLAWQVGPSADRGDVPYEPSEGMAVVVDGALGERGFPVRDERLEVERG